MTQGPAKPEMMRRAATRVRTLPASLLRWLRSTPLWRAFAADRLLLAGFVLLSLSAISPMFVTRYLPLTDLGFNGLAGLLPHVLLGDSFLNEWYKVNWQPVSRSRPPLPGGGSHRTVLVLFTYGSSGPPVVTPAAGRVTTSPYPGSA